MSLAQIAIDFPALARNFHTLEAISGVPVHPVVKANAYGLGADRIARRLMREGARVFFVARYEEGLALRDAIGPECTIWVLDGATSTRSAFEMMLADLRPILNGPEQLTHWAMAKGRPCGVHIDTGMNRLGFRVEDAPRDMAGVELVMSHLACGDEPSHPMNRVQRDAFAAATALYPGATRSFANSSGCFLGADFAFDAVRPGICLYGGGPEGRPDPRIQAVAAFLVTILQIRDVPTGETVGYAGSYTATKPMRVATLAAGYADGVLRSNSPNGQVFVGGELRPIVGRISMDLMAVDVTGLDVGVGDQVELFGPNRLLDDAAAAAGTVAWELLTAVGSRVGWTESANSRSERRRAHAWARHLRPPEREEEDEA
jgi:alanine racemase